MTDIPGSATEIAQLVRTGRLRAATVVEDALAKAEAAQQSTNAFTLLDLSGARHRADAIDRLIDSGRDPGPLSGVPIVLKDIIDDAGMPNSAGSSFPSDVAAASATVVRRLGGAGAIVIGRTGLHEFAFGFTSENPWFGPVRNPWNPTWSPGGSSGGSAAAVAAGVVPIGIGTDTGGSVRVPAAMCGVMGLKVSHGRVSLSGVFPLVESLDTVGPIARTVGDLTLAYVAMAGDDPLDPWTQPAHLLEPEAIVLEDVRLAIVSQWLDPPTSADVLGGLDLFRARCADAGVVVEDLDDPALAPDPSLGAAIGPEIIAVHGERFARHPERYGPDVAERIELAQSSTTDDVLASERWGAGARAALERHRQRGVTAFISPTVGVTHKTIGTPIVNVDGTEVFHREAMARFTSPINRIRVPALSVPVAGTGGPGVSVQVVGTMWSESRILGLGLALERAGIIGSPPKPVASTTA